SAMRPARQSCGCCCLLFHAAARKRPLARHRTRRRQRAPPGQKAKTPPRKAPERTTDPPRARHRNDHYVTEALTEEALLPALYQRLDWRIYARILEVREGQILGPDFAP